MLKIKSKNKFCFASEFTAARTMAGFSVAIAAKMCGRDVRTIRDWESGAKPCPAWALRLVVLESRYMDALYSLQTPRAYESMHLARGMAANAPETGKYHSGIAYGNSSMTLAYSLNVTPQTTRFRAPEGLGPATAGPTQTRLEKSRWTG